jgi:hypothetical protein
MFFSALAGAMQTIIDHLLRNKAWSTGMSIHHEVKTPSNQPGVFLKSSLVISCTEIHAQPPKVYMDDTYLHLLCFHVFMKHLGSLLLLFFKHVWAMIEV